MNAILEILELIKNELNEEYVRQVKGYRIDVGSERRALKMLESTIDIVRWMNERE